MSHMNNERPTDPLVSRMEDGVAKILFVIRQNVWIRLHPFRQITDVGRTQYR